MRRNLWASAAAALAIASLPAQGYETRVAEETAHYAINEVILQAGEQFDVPLKRRLVQEATRQGATKFHTTTAVFAPGSQGLKGDRIQEPALAIITMAAYGGEPKVTFMDKNRHVVDVGIYLPFRTLGEMVDNKILSPLLKELFEMPLILTEIPVSLASTDFRGDRWLVARDRSAVLLDLRITGSANMRVSDIGKIGRGCMVSFRGRADHALTEVPLLANLHGALLSFDCVADQGAGRGK
ncbi:MAG: hypothetical protein K6A65_03840 [Succinivibrionaceae bacterium]|nr:hypothetical protein [Succinivibrionaceae bacterium]